MAAEDSWKSSIYSLHFDRRKLFSW